MDKAEELMAKEFLGQDATTREDELARAKEEGTRIENVVCPICCLNRVLDKSTKGRSRFDNYDFDRPFIQVRYSSPSHGGFFMDRDESLSLREAKDMPEYQDLMEQLKQKCKEILELLG